MDQNKGRNSNNTTPYSQGRFAGPRVLTEGKKPMMEERGKTFWLSQWRVLGDIKGKAIKGGSGVVSGKNDHGARS